MANLCVSEELLFAELVKSDFSTITVRRSSTSVNLLRMLIHYSIIVHLQHTRLD
jgi:hypothetical protein